MIIIADEIVLFFKCWTWILILHVMGMSNHRHIRTFILLQLLLCLIIVSIRKVKLIVIILLLFNGINYSDLTSLSKKIQWNCIYLRDIHWLLWTFHIHCNRGVHLLLIILETHLNIIFSKLYWETLIFLFLDSLILMI